MRGGYDIPRDISGRIDKALNIECGNAALVRDPRLLLVCVFYQPKGDCPVRADTNSTHQSPRNKDPA